jgi:hypothetical protein
MFCGDCGDEALEIILFEKFVEDIAEASCPASAATSNPPTLSLDATKVTIRSLKGRCNVTIKVPRRSSPESQGSSQDQYKLTGRNTIAVNCD